jgi:hypothetical protein
MSDNETNIETCWLCTYSHTLDAKQYAQYVSENATSASMQAMALQISDDLNEKYPDARGADPSKVLEHIESHSLHPICKIAVMLRSLTKLTEDIQQSMRKQDDEGNVFMDTKLIEVYLKTQSQILSIYKTVESNKLLFSERSL